MSEQKLSVEIREDLISDSIRASIVQAIPDKEKFVARIVDNAMKEKSAGYPSQSLFQQAVEEMIREVAKEYRENPPRQVSPSCVHCPSSLIGTV